MRWWNFGSLIFTVIPIQDIQVICWRIPCHGDKAQKGVNLPFLLIFSVFSFSQKVHASFDLNSNRRFSRWIPFWGPFIDAHNVPTKRKYSPTSILSYSSEFGFLLLFSQLLFQYETFCAKTISALHAFCTLGQGCLFLRFHPI